MEVTHLFVSGELLSPAIFQIRIVLLQYFKIMGSGISKAAVTNSILFAMGVSLCYLFINCMYLLCQQNYIITFCFLLHKTQQSISVHSLLTFTSGKSFSTLPFTVDSDL